MTGRGPRSRTLLDDPRALRLTSVLVILVLFTTTGLDGPAAWQVGHGAATVACCIWVLAHRRRRHRMTQALAIAALGGALAGAGAGAEVGAGPLLVLGTTVLVRSIRRCWLATAVGVLVLGSAAHLTDIGVSTSTVAAPSSVLTVALVVLLVILDRITAAATAASADPATLDAGLDRDRARLGDELRSQIGRTLSAARHDIRTAIDTASTREQPVGVQVTEQRRALYCLVGQGIDQLDRLSVEPIAATLPSELHAAREVCERLGIVAVVSADEVADHAVADAAALVLREAVTNMLRHATPTRCVIAIRCSADDVVLSVTNDGTAHPSAGSVPVGAGSGQRRWRRTVGHLDARISAGAIDGGRYQVLVRFPAGSSRPTGPGSGRHTALAGRKGTRWGFGS